MLKITDVNDKALARSGEAVAARLSTRPLGVCVCACMRVCVRVCVKW